MSGTSSHVNGSLQHQCAERDSWNPADEADESEHAKNQEDDTASILVFHEIVDTSTEGKDDVQDACDPDKEFCEVSSAQEVGPREYQGNAENEDE